MERAFLRLQTPVLANVLAELETLLGENEWVQLVSQHEHEPMRDPIFALWELRQPGPEAGAPWPRSRGGCDERPFLVAILVVADISLLEIFEPEQVTEECLQWVYRAAGASKIGAAVFAAQKKHGVDPFSGASFAARKNPV